MRKELQRQWNLHNVPENHKDYFMETIQTMSKFDAIEKILQEVNDFKIGKAYI
jgi:hypothetical protein